VILINKKRLISLGILIIISIILAGCSSNDMDIAKKHYSLNVTTDEQKGIIEIDPEKSSYSGGVSIEITAIANDCYKFDRWQGSGFDNNTNNPLTIKITNDITLVAIFKESVPPEWITDPKITTAAGTNSVGISIETNETGNVYYKVLSDGAAIPTAQEVISAVNGVSVEENTIKEIIIDNLDAGTNYDIFFIAEDETGNLQSDCMVKKVDVITESYTFELNVGDNGSVTVTEPDNNEVVVNNNYVYRTENIESLQLVANAVNKRWTFKNWSGDYTGENETIEIQLDSDKTVDAEFEGNVFKLINSWGENWGPLNNGSLFITYDAAINANLSCYLMEAKDDYQPRALALFKVDNDYRGDWKFEIKITDRIENNIKYLYPLDINYKSGDHPFPDNFIALDITEFLPLENEDIVLTATNDSICSGILETFKIEIYDNGINQPPSEEFISSNSNINICSCESKTATIYNITTNLSSAMSISLGDGFLESVSRKINSSDIEKFTRDQVSINTGNDKINGHGTGWKTMTKKQWEKAMKNETIKIIEPQKVLDNFNTNMLKSSSSIIIDHSQSNHFPPVDSQGSEGSCTAWSTAYYTQGFYEARDHNWILNRSETDKLMSPDFVYHLINDGDDNGSCIYDAMLIMENIGVASLLKKPYSDTDHTSWPDTEAFREASQYRSSATEQNDNTEIDNYGRFYYIYIESEKDIEALQLLIQEGYLTTTSVNADKYDSLTENGVWTTENYIGDSTNHANTIVGFYK